MARGVAVKSLDQAGGQQLAGGQNVLHINGQPVVVVGDPVEPHGKDEHRRAEMVEGSSVFTIQGKPVCIEGNRASCGHATTGQANFTIAK